MTASMVRPVSLVAVRIRVARAGCEGELKTHFRFVNFVTGALSSVDITIRKKCLFGTLALLAGLAIATAASLRGSSVAAGCSCCNVEQNITQASNVFPITS
jgi:hypothetical protein